MSTAPHAQKVRLRELSTGDVIERWPVDARALVDSGEYEVVEAVPVPGETPAEVDPMPHVTQAKAGTQSSPTGAALAVAPLSGISAAAPVQLPVGRTTKKG